MDVLALALLRAADMVERDLLGELKARRYAGWDGELGQRILAGSSSLASVSEEALAQAFNPRHISGEQERLENLVNRFIHG
jgi:xylose isomerase